MSMGMLFVGVEVAKNPKLKGLPVITGEERGIATALSCPDRTLPHVENDLFVDGIRTELGSSRE